MPENTINMDDFKNTPDLERKILVILSMFEANRKSENSDEYTFPDGKRVRPTAEGIKSFMRDGATLGTGKMQASIGQLLEKKLITEKSGSFFLSDVGKGVGKKFRIERMSKAYDDLLSRTGTSKAYSMFCERVFGKDLSQFNVLDTEQLTTLIGKLDLKPGEQVLDLGCGNGRIAEHISDTTGAKMVGLDFASELIKRSQQRTSDKKSRLTYVVGNMNELTFEQGSFDAAISIDTLYFVDSIDATIRELKKLLKPPTGRLGIFYDQSCNPDESRDILLPENTNVGKALTNNRLIFQTVNFTSNSREIWIREIKAAEELKELFVKEGNTDIYEDRAQDAKRTLDSIESGRQVRHLYLAKPQ